MAENENPDLSSAEEKETTALPDLEGARFPRRRGGSLVRKVFYMIVLVAVVLAGIEGVSLLREHFRNFKSTDNAYVRATVVPVSPQIAGVVREMIVSDNQAVHAGDLLARMDDRRFQVAVEKARAAVRVAHARYEGAKVSVVHSQGRVSGLLEEARARMGTLRKTLRSAQALLIQRRKETMAMTVTLGRTRIDLERKKSLHRQRIISDEDLMMAEAYYKVANANRGAAKAALRVEEEKVAAMQQQLKEHQASIGLAKNEERSERMKELSSESLKAELEAANVDLKEARLLLSYAEIRAPISGYVSKTVDRGIYIEKGRPLLAIVQLHKAYIRANFKEIQIEDIRVGQPATIVVDAYPNRIFRGRVDSVYSGTGDAFALFPPVNATGNWVKIMRRVPVKIVLNEAPPPQFPLLVGMSAQVRVDVRDRSGTRLLAYPSRTQKNPTGIR